MRKLNSFALAATVVLVLGGGIAVSAVLGHWQTESQKIPSRFTTGEFSGSFDPASIRGSYTLGDVAQAFTIPVDVIAQAFGVAELGDTASLRANTFEAVYLVQDDGGEVGTDALRYFVSLYLGLPYTPEETTRLPEPSFAVLAPKLAPADQAALAERTVPLADLLPAGASLADLVADDHEETTASTARGDAIESLSGDTTGADPVGEDPAGTESAGTDTASTQVHVDDLVEIRGRTTFAELLDWGLTQVEIEKTIGMKMPVRAANVRDTLVDAGRDFGTYRTLLQALLDERTATVGE